MRNILQEEKALALFYTLIEVLKGNRSYLQYKYQDLHQVKSNYKDWEDFFDYSMLEWKASCWKPSKMRKLLKDHLSGNITAAALS